MNSRDVLGQTSALVDARGNRHRFVYDSIGARTQLIDPLNRRTTSAYDAAGQQNLRIELTHGCQARFYLLHTVPPSRLRRISLFSGELRRSGKTISEIRVRFNRDWRFFAWESAWLVTVGCCRLD